MYWLTAAQFARSPQHPLVCHDWLGMRANKWRKGTPRAQAWYDGCNTVRHGSTMNMLIVEGMHPRFHFRF
jgi:transposase